jgi:hypothetical protein
MSAHISDNARHIRQGEAYLKNLVLQFFDEEYAKRVNTQNIVFFDNCRNAGYTPARRNTGCAF